MPDAPPPGRYEHLAGGDDAPGVTDRLDAVLHRHGRWYAVGAVLAALGAIAWLLVAHPWRAAEQDGAAATADVTVRVGRTDSVGTVVEPGAEPVVRIEAKVDLAGPAGTTGRVRGFVGPGVVSSSSSMPTVSAGASVVGLVTARVRCDTVFGDDESFALAVDVTTPGGQGQVDGRLDRLERPWLALLRTACPTG